MAILLSNFTISRITTICGIFTTPMKVNSSSQIENCTNLMFHTYIDKRNLAYYSSYIWFESINNIKILISELCTYISTRTIEVLAKDKDKSSISR